MPSRRDFIKAGAGGLGVAAMLAGCTEKKSTSSPSVNRSAGAAAAGANAGYFIDVRDQRGYAVDAADNSEALQAAFDAAMEGKRGGRVFIPREGVKTAKPLNLRLAHAVTVEGVAGNSGLGGDLSKQYSILYTGGGSDTFLDASGSLGLVLRDMRINYDNRKFTGKLIALEGSPETNQSGAIIENCLLGGTSDKVSSCSYLVSLHNSITTQLRNNTYTYAEVGILGKDGPGFANAIQIENGQFLQLTKWGIKNPAQAWLIKGVTFEPIQGHRAAACIDEVGAFGPVVFDGCWFGDTATREPNEEVPPWIRYKGNGLVVRDSLVAGPAADTGAPGIILDPKGSAMVGVGLYGNTFAGCIPIVKTLPGAGIHSLVAIGNTDLNPNPNLLDDSANAINGKVILGNTGIKDSLIPAG